MLPQKRHQTLGRSARRKGLELVVFVVVGVIHDALHDEPGQPPCVRDGRFVIADVPPRADVVAYLEKLGLPTEAPPIARARMAGA